MRWMVCRFVLLWHLSVMLFIEAAPELAPIGHNPLHSLDMAGDAEPRSLAPSPVLVQEQSKAVTASKNTKTCPTVKLPSKIRLQNQLFGLVHRMYVFERKGVDGVYDKDWKPQDFGSVDQSMFSFGRTYTWFDSHGLEVGSGRMPPLSLMVEFYIRDCKHDRVLVLKQKSILWFTWRVEMTIEDMKGNELGKAIVATEWHSIFDIHSTVKFLSAKGNPILTGRNYAWVIRETWDLDLATAVEGEALELTDPKTPVMLVALFTGLGDDHFGLIWLLIITVLVCVFGSVGLFGLWYYKRQMIKINRTGRL